LFIGDSPRGRGRWFSARLALSRCYSSALAARAAKRWRNTIHLLRPIHRKGTRRGSRFLPLPMATTMRRRSMRQWCKALRFLQSGSDQSGMGRLPAPDTDAEFPAIPPISRRRPLAASRTGLCSRRTATSPRLVERALTMACPAPSRPAQPVRPNKMQFCKKRCDRLCRSDPLKLVRDQTTQIWVDRCKVIHATWPHSRPTCGPRLVQCNHRKTMSERALERLRTMAFLVPFPPAQPVLLNRTQSRGRGCSRGCRSDPAQSVRDHTIRR
jgi:hypothetical protein